MDAGITRREALKFAAACAVMPQMRGEASPRIQSIKRRLPGSLPVGVAAIIADTLNKNPASLNTDWYGTMLIYGLLQWEPALPGIRSFARRWLDYHRNLKRVSKYTGPPSRTFDAGGVEITSYSGQYGLAFPCYQMTRLFGSDAARAVCLDIADFILHQSRRDRMGMVAADDNAEYAIPDTCFFAVGPLIFASTLDPQCGNVFRRQAIFQLRTYTDVFLVRETGLVKTVLLRSGLGKTYWTRSSGWLLWAMIAVLDHLPQRDPHTKTILNDLNLLAKGIERVQDQGGGFHVFLDEPTSPLETTGSAMFATGFHEAIRKGWLPRSFSGSAARAWSFVKGNVKDDGEIGQVYTGWAIPAEKGRILMDRIKMGWIPGFILLAANELTTGERPP